MNQFGLQINLLNILKSFEYYQNVESIFYLLCLYVQESVINQSFNITVLILFDKSLLSPYFTRLLHKTNFYKDLNFQWRFYPETNICVNTFQTPKKWRPVLA